MEVANLVARFSADGDERVIGALNRVDAGVTRVADNSGRAGRGLGSVFSIAGGFLGAQAVTHVLGMARGLVQAQADAEQTRIRLEVVTGSAQQAEQLLGQVQDLAAKTPFSFPELADAAANLESFGLKSMEWLTIIGDTAAGTGKSVDQVTQALLDAQAGEYERLKELGIQARVEGDKLTFSYMKNGREITETVDKNNQEQINSTLQAIWSSKYQGAMEKQSKTFAGQMSTLKDNVSLAMQSMTAGVFGFATKGLAFVNSIFANGFRATIESTFGDAGARVLDFFDTIIGGAGRLGAALVAAFGEGAPVSDLVKLLPPGLQEVGEKLLLVADAAGDLYSAFQSRGFSGLLRQLPQELMQVGRMLFDVAKSLGQSIVDAIQQTDLSGVGQKAGEIARTLIVGIAQWLPEHWDEVVIALTALMLALPGAIVGIGTLLVPKAIELIRGFVDGLNINWSAVGEYFRGLPARIVAQVPDLSQTLQAHGGGLISGLWNGAVQAWFTVNDWLGSRGEAVVAAIGDLSGLLVDVGAATVQGLWSGAEGVWTGVTTWLENFGGEILLYVGDLSGLLWDVGTSLVAGMANGVRAGAGMVADAVNAIVGSIPPAVRRLLGIASPSKVMRDLFYEVPRGAALGIEDGAHLVSRAMGGLAAGVAPVGTGTANAPRVRVSGGTGSGRTQVINLDLRGALIGRGAEAEIMAIVKRNAGAVVDPRVRGRALAGA